jgi:iron complex outermembrane receptor protein
MFIDSREIQASAGVPPSGHHTPFAAGVFKSDRLLGEDTMRRSHIHRFNHESIFVSRKIRESGVRSPERHTNNKASLFAGIAAFLASAISPNAVGQEQETATSTKRTAAIEEIIVTAQKRAESIQNVPISMIALQGDELQNLGVKQADDVFRVAPNLGVVNHVGPTQSNYFIRGVGTLDFHLNTISPVGVYLDEVSINSPFGNGFSLFDMERIEVMRGPQNTLFGRNTTGGAVNYITRRPEIDKGLNGYVSATYGRFDQIDVEAAVGFPLGQNAAARISLLSNDRDGAFDNLTTGRETFDRQLRAGRAQLLWRPTETLAVLIKAHGGVNRGSGIPSHAVGLLDPTDLTAPCPVPASQLTVENNPNCAVASGFVPQRDDFNDVFGGTDPRTDLDLRGVSARVDWEFNSMTLTSISAFDSTEIRMEDDPDGAPTVLFEFFQDGDLDQWSQDLRLASAQDQSLRWMLGFLYFLEEADYATVVRRTPEPLAPSGPGAFNTIPNTIVRQDDEVFSGYFQVEYDILSKLTGTAGFRYMSETKDGTNAASVRGTGGFLGPVVPEGTFIDTEVVESAPLLFAPPVDILDETFNEWAVRFALEYQTTEDILLYGSVSRGVKAGGFSLAALQALTGLGAQPVDTEILWAYEIGMKSAWFDNSLQANAAIFYYDWEDLQSFQLLFDPSLGFGVPQLTNVPESSLLGGELEVTWVPAQGWFLKAGAGLLDAEIDEPGNLLGVSQGNVLPNSPDLTFNGLVRKEFQLGPGTFALQTDFRFQDDVSFGLENAPTLNQDGYGILNARGIYSSGPDGRYQITVWGENLTDTEYCGFLAELRGLSENVRCAPNIGKPTYGVTVGMRFE